MRCCFSQNILIDNSYKTYIVDEFELNDDDIKIVVSYIKGDRKKLSQFFT